MSIADTTSRDPIRQLEENQYLDSITKGKYRKFSTTRIKATLLISSLQIMNYDLSSLGNSSISEAENFRALKLLFEVFEEESEENIILNQIRTNNNNCECLISKELKRGICKYCFANNQIKDIAKNGGFL